MQSSTQYKIVIIQTVVTLNREQMFLHLRILHNHCTDNFVKLEHVCKVRTQIDFIAKSVVSIVNKNSKRAVLAPLNTKNQTRSNKNLR